jgi:hypothetical protein
MTLLEMSAVSSILPVGVRHIATYRYGKRGEIVVNVYALRRGYYLRDAAGKHPMFHAGGILVGTREPHPNDGTEDMDISYETVGLFYGYPMPDTGWSGDC